MATCNYCNATIKSGTITCPHCGANLSTDPINTVKVENIHTFSIQATFKPNYFLKKKTVLFVLVPFLVAPIILTMLFGILIGVKHGQITMRDTEIFLLLTFFSTPVSFLLLLYNYSLRTKRTKCLVSDNTIDCVTDDGIRRIVSVADIINIDNSQTSLQNKYKIGDISIVVSPGGAGNVMVLKNVDNYDTSFIKLKNFIDSVQNNSK